MMSESPIALALVGATAVGKTGLSVALARALDGEIISMDSRQVYRGMNVGTAKVHEAEKEGIRHHGIDIRDPNESYSAGQFGRDARRWIQGITDRGRVPILVGGTGFFLKVLLEPLFPEPDLDPARKKKLRDFLGEMRRDELERWVSRLDPVRAGVAIAGGPQRMIRVVVVALLSGRPLSWWHRTALPEGDPIPIRVVHLHANRSRLYDRINARVDAMVAQGLVAEVEALTQAGFRRTDPGMTGTGYRQILDYLEGQTTLPEAAELIRIATRKYARRQLTWFRHQLPSGYRMVETDVPLEEQEQQVIRFWRGIE